MRHRDYISEIEAKLSHLHARSPREELFHRRVFAVVRMMRTARQLEKTSELRPEMLRASAIGYIACVEGYFRIAMANLIDGSPVYRANVARFADSLRSADLIALYDRKVTLGHYVAHLLPINNVSDIDGNMSKIIGQDFLHLVKRHRIGVPESPPLGKISPKCVMYLDSLFKLRHVFAHELATKFPVRARSIELAIGHSAVFMGTVENAINLTLLPVPTSGSKRKGTVEHGVAPVGRPRTAACS